ncbi:hypothetical protein K2X14_10145 [Acetobacter sp. TBRC 12305]|nr:hypothetical protein [Acetobacter garciniae]MBX0345193.1 hypothetical protein [Acetobacter garciniae]
MFPKKMRHGARTSSGSLPGQGGGQATAHPVRAEATGPSAGLPQPGPMLARYLATYRPGGFPPPAALLVEARSLLPRIEQALAPLDPALLQASLRDFAEILNAGVANPLPGVGLDLRCQALAVVCADLPAMVWTGAVMHDALCQFRFFPSAAEVRAFLHARCAPLYGMAACLRLMLAQAERHTTRQPAQF